MDVITCSNISETFVVFRRTLNRWTLFVVEVADLFTG